MNKPRLPLWLICDSPAALRLWLSLMLFGWVKRLFIPRNEPRPFLSPEAAAWLIETLALAESLLRWAITRQAFRLCGLDPATARLVHLEGAEAPLAWHVRHRTLFATLRTMSAHARRQAARIRQTRASAKPGRPAAPARSVVVFVMVASSSPFFFFLCEPVRRFPQAAAGQPIRAPPLLRIDLSS